MSDLAIASETNGQYAQYLTFVLKSEYYGIAINSVKEIIEHRAITTIPLMPEFVKGVLNLRGEVVPVIDLNMRFGKSPSEVCKRSCIVIVEITYEQQIVLLGIVVDAVNEVLDITASQIEPPPTFGAKIRAEFIHGIANIEEQFIVLLKMEKVLSVDEMAALIERAID
ncbi:chemotaxis protein CheW [Pseudoalteromonas piscicida]|uniref:Chemotaxis protein CheW n=1 Tax=Pseudoalteromonas piscicida TaxID=43662 RepID=A0A2A5JPF4_PSEO7|nr:chemotaxis protein CheW [Pseudoalteromonas piscicida]PCK31141.1 chemotaxis protein CheW [Pseudoalteromonas piscicida]